MVLEEELIAGEVVVDRYGPYMVPDGIRAPGGPPAAAPAERAESIFVHHSVGAGCRMRWVHHGVRSIMGDHKANRTK